MKNLKKVNTDTGEVFEQKKRILRQLEFEFDKKKMTEKNMGKSMTIPNQSMTVLEMIQRHRKGLPIEGRPGQIYHEGEEPLQNLDNMDLIDRQNYIDSVADALVEVKRRLEENAKTEKEKEFLKKVDMEVRQRLAAMKNPPKAGDEAEVVE